MRQDLPRAISCGALSLPRVRPSGWGPTFRTLIKAGQKRVVVVADGHPAWPACPPAHWETRGRITWGPLQALLLGRLAEVMTAYAGLKPPALRPWGKAKMAPDMALLDDALCEAETSSRAADTSESAAASATATDAAATAAAAEAPDGAGQEAGRYRCGQCLPMHLSASSCVVHLALVPYWRGSLLLTPDDHHGR